MRYILNSHKESYCKEKTSVYIICTRYAIHVKIGMCIFFKPTYIYKYYKIFRQWRWRVTARVLIRLYEWVFRGDDSGGKGSGKNVLILSVSSVKLNGERRTDHIPRSTACIHNVCVYIYILYKPV